MSQWTSKYAMLKDLSVAQGQRVPAALEPTFGNKRPSVNFVEATEEEFFKDCVGDGDFDSGPDLRLIQQMLSMVREKHVSSDDEPDKVITISKLNPLSQEFLPSDTNDTKKAKKPKKKRHNVALNSILDALPIAEREEVLNNGISRDPTPLLHPMFRLKKISPVKSNPVTTPVKNDCAMYKPSSLASEYYNKYVEKSRLKEIVQDDIWTRAEKKMKEIDERKRLEALSSPSSSSKSSQDGTTTSDDSSTIAHGVEFVPLSVDRHQLTNTCVVCELTKKHGYDIRATLNETFNMIRPN